MQLITVRLEIGFGQSSVNVQDLENLQLHQQPLQLPQQPPPLLEKWKRRARFLYNMIFYCKAKNPVAWLEK